MDFLAVVTIAFGAALLIPSPRAELIRQHRCEGCGTIFRCKQCEDIIRYALAQKGYKGTIIYCLEHQPKGGGGGRSQEKWLCDACKAGQPAPTVVERLLRVL